MSEDNTKFNPPKSLEIENYIYSYKGQLIIILVIDVNIEKHVK